MPSSHRLILALVPPSEIGPKPADYKGGLEPCGCVTYRFKAFQQFARSWRDNGKKKFSQNLQLRNLFKPIEMLFQLMPRFPQWSLLHLSR
jgi:hypothetical protein